MKFCATLLLLAVTLGYAQFFPDSNSIDVTGDAAINIAPDRVRLNFGVETRNKALDAAVTQNDAMVRRVMAAIRGFQIDAGDIQTENIHLTLGYDSRDSTLIDYYEVSKGVQVFLRDVSKFEPLLTAVLRAGANHIYDVDFSTSELRKYRDQARALAIKAATEKANDMSSAASLKVTGKPVALTAYNYGGGSWYSACCSNRYGAQGFQNIIQNVGGGGVIGNDATVALGKISVTASVTMKFRVE
jgi:uncharacterized protein YggE